MFKDLTGQKFGLLTAISPVKTGNSVKWVCRCECGNKDTIQNAINCLRCSDETMADYLTIIKLAYPNIHRTITQSDYLRHSHNRLYVYNTARQVLA